MSGSAMTIPAGTRLGPYEILALLGVGGMGAVYRARDARLGREVAVKVLPDDLARDPDALARFEREARALAVLSHPNVVGIYDFGCEGTIAYAALELLDGQTMGARLAAGPVSAGKAVEIMVQVARGLAAAHGKGIVHRDLKPENIFITTEGVVKVLDFGLARVRTIDPVLSGSKTVDRTRPGMILGTASYMSPEQIRSQPADHRSDIFSFGIVLYETISGRNPFRMESVIETMNAILTDEPPGLPEPGRAALHPLERLARRCLEKDPEQRFQSARDVAFALEAYGASVPVRAAARPSRPADGRRSVAVLPFKDLAGEPGNEHLGVGLADATITELALVRSLLVRPTATILGYRDRSVPPETAGRELGVDAVLDASFQRSGSRLRVTVQLVRTEDGKTLWGSKIDASLDDIFAMQDHVSRKIAEALEVELTPSDERRLARAAQPAAGAYELYIKGRVHLLYETRQHLATAIESFEKARALDPASALPLVGLAEAYVRMAFTFEPEGDWYARAVAMTDRALAIDGSLPEGRFLRARLLWTPQRGFDHAGALRELHAAAAARPSLSQARHWLGTVLFHIAMFDESESELQLALAINPEDIMANGNRGTCLFFRGRWAEARAITEESLRLTPDATWTHYQLTHALLRLGDRSSAEQVVAMASIRFPGDVLFHPLRAILAASGGDRAEALRQIDLTVQNARNFGHYHHAQYDVACAHALLGDRDKALSWLTDAATHGFPCYAFFEIDPYLAPLRADPRFTALMARLRAECDTYSALWRDLQGSSGDSLSPRPD